MNMGPGQAKQCQLRAFLTYYINDLFLNQVCKIHTRQVDTQQLIWVVYIWRLTADLQTGAETVFTVRCGMKSTRTSRQSAKQPTLWRSWPVLIPWRSWESRDPCCRWGTPQLRLYRKSIEVGWNKAHFWGGASPGLPPLFILWSKLRRQRVNSQSLLFRVCPLATGEQLGALTKENPTLPASLALPPLCTTVQWRNDLLSALTLFCEISFSSVLMPACAHTHAHARARTESSDFHFRFLWGLFLYRPHLWRVPARIGTQTSCFSGPEPQKRELIFTLLTVFC